MGLLMKSIMDRFDYTVMHIQSGARQLNAV